MSSLRCPCRKKSETVVYEACCGRFHAGEMAPTPEALMRSRYSAFALGKIDYLLATWHPSTRPKELNLDREEHWLSLRVESSETAADGHAGKVTFVARWREKGTTRTLAETSRFVREAGKWLYVSGIARTS
jgi:SEC-C motif-containing protein